MAGIEARHPDQPLTVRKVLMRKAEEVIGPLAFLAGLDIHRLQKFDSFRNVSEFS